MAKLSTTIGGESCTTDPSFPEEFVNCVDLHLISPLAFLHAAFGHKVIVRHPCEDAVIGIGF